MTELNLAEIREYMLKNNCKVTNHALVKHFKKFLTNVETQDEARRKFKTYVNILATIKNENGEKYLVLRKKFINEVPIEDPITAINTVGLPPVSPSQAGSRSSNSSFQSEFDTFSPQVGARQPPPYRPPPEVLSPAISNHSLNMSQNSSTSLLTPGNKLPFLEAQTEDFYRECVDEFQIAMNALKERDREKKLARQNSVPSLQGATPPPPPPPIMRQSSVDVPPPTPPKKLNLSRENSLPNEQKTPSTAEPSPVAENKENVENESDSNKISVKEAMQKFNRFASEEEAKIPSPIGKVNKKIDECDQGKTDEDDYALNLMQHPKAKEWIISACKGDYQKMSKLAKEFPVLVKLKEPNSNALHWASKQGNSDVVKLVAGTYKLDVNERTGYTALHIAIQHGKVDIFELLSNVYKADRNLTDWYGKKPLEYQQKQTKSVSSSTYSKIKARKKQSEKDLGFLRIGSLNARVKKTRESFNSFMGGSNKISTRYPQQFHHHPMENPKIAAVVEASAPLPQFNLEDKNKMHKSWGSADNIPISQSELMPPPNNKYTSKKLRRGKRDIEIMGLNNGPYSTPTTPNTLRSSIGVLSEQPGLEVDSDSDGAAGFDESWKRTSNPTTKAPPTYL
uniref:CSON003447 protein n=1 Tax=Culicoides sonorensis TaxID=179676 RepID=A0A336MNF3_CULSO